jgi:hypothetical protein
MFPSFCKLTARRPLPASESSVRVRRYFKKNPYVGTPVFLKCRSSYRSRSLSDLTLSFQFVSSRSRNIVIFVYAVGGTILCRSL